MGLEIEQVKITCKACGEKEHDWNEVDYTESSRLIKADKLYITWCKNKNRFELYAKKKLHCHV